MKKLILTVMFVFAVLCHTVSAYDADYKETLKSLELYPQDITDSELGETAVREDLAYMLSKLMDGIDRGTVNTDYVDVKSDNINSGYISNLRDFGIMIGYDDNHFIPQGSVTARDAYVTVLRLLGYGGHIKSDVISIQDFADNVGISDKIHVDASQEITNEQMMRIIYNALTAPLCKITVDGDLYFPENNETMLSDRMEINVYQGEILDFDDANMKVSVRIDKNIYDNYENIPTGTVDYFSVKDASIYKYENAPVIIWVDSNSNVLRVYEQRNTQIRYGVIYSVNGDDSEESIYSINHITKLEMLGDKDDYDVSASAVMVFNGERTVLPEKLINKMAKVVIVDDTVVSVESWDLGEAGLITAVEGSYLEYANATAIKNRIKNITDFDACRVLINAEPSEYNKLKKDSVLKYYKSDDYLMIVATEQMICEELNSVSNSEVQVGTVSYKADNVSYSRGENKYSKTDYSSLIGKKVDAFLDEANRCVFVRMTIFGDEEKTLRKFMGVVNNTYIDEDTEQEVVSLFVLEPEIEKKEFKISEKARYKDGITFETMSQNKRDMNGNGVYEFRINSKGEIIEIFMPQLYYGIGNPEATVTSFPDAAYPEIPFFDSQINAYMVVKYGETRHIALSNNDGEFSVREVSYSDLRRKYASGLKLRLYGTDKDTTARMALLYGDTSDIYGWDTRMGLLTEKNEYYDDTTDSVRVEAIINDKKYVLSPETAASLPERGLLVWKEMSVLSAEPIKVIQKIDLSGDINNWKFDRWGETAGNGGYGFRRATVTYVDEKRICFTNDRGYFFYTSVAYTYNTKSGKFLLSSLSDVSVGDSVACLINDAVRVLIVIE